MYEKFSNRLDLFKIHDSKDNTKNWILCKGKNLKNQIKLLIKKTNFFKTDLVKYLMKKLKISITTAERLVYLKREWYPLVFIEELVYLTNADISNVQNKIEFLKSSKPPVVVFKAVKKLTINLCKLIGAHAADGTLYDNRIAITDRYKTNILALIGWLGEFNYSPKIRKISENEYGISTSSRLLSRYFTKFFDFPSGCKQYTVKEPEIIKNSSLKFRKAFALGALTFEAGLGMKNQVEFCVSSKAFRDSIVEILTELDLQYISMKKPSSSYWRFWSNKLSKEEAIKWMELFEPHTEKWFKLNDYVNGFSKRISSFEEAVNIFNKIYPKQSSSKVILTDVLMILKELKKAHRYKIVDYLIKKNNLKSYGGKWANSLGHYLNILKRANIISVTKGKFGKKKSFGTIIRDVYIYNENISEWRVPERKIIL